MLLVSFAEFNYNLQAVKDGYQLALIYRLVQGSAGPLPVFQDITQIMYGVEDVLEGWEAEEMTPKRGFCILDNEYEPSILLA